MQASVAIQVLPDVQSEDELIRIVDEVIAYIKSTGLNCYVGPFETTIEGESYDQLMEIVRECQNVAIRGYRGLPCAVLYAAVAARCGKSIFRGFPHLDASRVRYLDGGVFGITARRTACISACHADGQIPDTL